MGNSYPPHYLPTTIERILAHLGRDAEPVDPAYPSRAPPQGELSF